LILGVAVGVMGSESNRAAIEFSLSTTAKRTLWRSEVGSQCQLIFATGGGAAKRRRNKRRTLLHWSEAMKCELDSA
jgi:hypothetical protein